MSSHKMLKVYRTLLNHAKASIITTEQKTWDILGHAIKQAEQANHAFSELTAKEFKQVQKDLYADIMQIAVYLTEVEKGVEAFIRMDLPLLEKILLDKALSLADPTEITVLHFRLSAAMGENQPIFGHQTKY